MRKIEKEFVRYDRYVILKTTDDILAFYDSLHSVEVLYRDLKPQNIMVRNKGGEVLLIDFGPADSGDYAELKQG